MERFTILAALVALPVPAAARDYVRVGDAKINRRLHRRYFNIKMPIRRLRQGSCATRETRRVMPSIELLFVALATFLLLAIVGSKAATRTGVPVLLLFLAGLLLEAFIE